MASESGKSGSLAKVFQKRVVRTKEKVLQNLGKADRTTDDVFNEHANNFKRQEASANKLHKELKNYVQCVKDMSSANRHFYCAVKEAYEPDWMGYQEVERAVESLNFLWEDYLEKLVQSVQTPLQTYTSRFPETKQKMAKRGRKLVDYDIARHNHETQHANKKRDEGKILKSQEELREARRVYDQLNTDLHIELPALYESRIDALSSTFHTLFFTEAKFSEETSKLMGELADLSERLSRESGHGGFRPAILTSPVRPDGEMNDSSAGDAPAHGHSTFYNVSLNSESPEPQLPGNQRASVESSGADTSPSTVISPEEVQVAQAAVPPATVANGDLSGSEHARDDVTADVTGHVEESTYEPVSVGAQQVSEGPEDGAASPRPPEGAEGGESLYSLASDTDDIYKVPTSNTPVDPSKLPQGVLFQVQGTHPYAGEDTDELTFDAGDVINVMPFEDPEDQDEGWLFGVKISTGEKGVFPENFTKRI